MRFAYEITDEDKDEYIELIYAGVDQNTAAAQLDTTGSQFRKFRNADGVHYDADFTARYEEARRSETRRQNREDHLRTLIDERSEKSDAVLIKRAMAELPEWEKLRHTNFRHEISGEIAHKLFPHFSDEEIAKAIEKAERERELERGELKLLPPAADEA